MSEQHSKGFHILNKKDNKSKNDIKSTIISTERHDAVKSNPWLQPLRHERLVRLAFPLPCQYDANRAYCVTVDDVYTKAECDTIIAMTEKRGYAPALVNIGRGRQQRMDDFRNSMRCMYDDPAFAAELWSRIAWAVPPRFNGCKVVGLNERMRFLRYDPGQKFDSHFDGQFTRSNGERSYITYQLYLNGGFGGGATTFIDPTLFTNAPRASCVPAPGRILLFQHDLLHRGDTPVSGRKYVLRTDVMYEAPAEETQADGKAESKTTS